MSQQLNFDEDAMAQRDTNVNFQELLTSVNPSVIPLMRDTGSISSDSDSSGTIDLTVDVISVSSNSSTGSDDDVKEKGEEDKVKAEVKKRRGKYRKELAAFIFPVAK